MDAALKMLIEILPPPEDPSGRDVDWPKFERVLEFTYPTTFKDFVAVYGGSIFLDNYSHFYPGGSTVNAVETFFDTASSKFKLLVDYDLYDEEFSHVKVELYPERNGLFPFMCDYSSYEYFWQTGEADPDKWPIICWETGILRRLKHASLAEMLLEEIEFWKVDEPGRAKVARWVEPPQPPPTKDEIDDPAGAFESAIQIGHKKLLEEVALAKTILEKRGGNVFRGS